MRAVQRSWLRALVVSTLVLGACTEMDEQGLTPPEQQPSAVGGQGEDLFAIGQMRTLAAQQQSQVSVMADRPATVDAQVATLSGQARSVLEDDRPVGFRVSPSERFLARAERRSQQPGGRMYWSGRLVGVQGSAELVHSSNGITGIVRTPDYVYFIDPVAPGRLQAAGGLHAIIKVDRSRLQLGDDTPSEVGTLLPNLPIGTLAAKQRIRVTTAYTPAVRNRHPSMCDYVGLIRGSINNSYVKSGIYDDLVVDAYCGSLHQVDYAGLDGGCQTHLNHLTRGADGKMDEIKAVRRSNTSDIVILLVTDSSCGGLADRILAYFNSAYAVVGETEAVSIFGVAHEIGHLQGARHDRFMDDLNYPYKHGHGYVDPQDEWHTIMAYDNDCNNRCPAIQFWSNPGTSRDGRPMGTSTYENNARVLRQTASRTAHLWGPMTLRIEGPRTLSGREFGRCTWTAEVSRGATPKQFQWSGIFSGGGAVKIARLTRSGEATVRVRDASGQTLTESIFISVDDENPTNQTCKK